jgi:hypothetical protein
MDEEEALETCREDIEALLQHFISEAGSNGLSLIEDWVLVASTQELDVTPSGDQFIFLSGATQSPHRTIGLMTVALDELRSEGVFWRDGETD